MSKSYPSPGARLRATWKRLSPLPGGKWLFGRILGWLNPYSGALGASFIELEPGHARLALKDRRRVRNHLDSVHAIALANLAELASGLALLTALPASARGIPVSFSIEFLKKARGTLTAECRCTLPDVTGSVDYKVTPVIRDASGEDVARATVTWKLGLVPAL